MGTKHTWTNADGLRRYGGPRVPEGNNAGAEKAVDKEITSSVSGDGALATLNALAQSDQRLSSAKTRAEYEDNLATQFKETWANLGNWAQTAGTGTQVSGGKLFAGTAPGGNSGMNKAWVVPAAGKFRATFNIDYKTAGSGGVIVGVSSDALNAGAPVGPAAAAASARGIYFRQQATTVQSVDQGVFANVSNTTLPTAGRYRVTVMADDVMLSITARKVDGSLEYRCEFPRAGYNINNLYVFNSDASQLTGSSVDFVGASYGFATMQSRVGVEDFGNAVFARSNGLSGASLEQYRVALPVTYDSRTPSPVVWFFHGSGTGAYDINDNAFYNMVAKAFNDAGFIVASCNFASKTTWGAQGSLDVYLKLYRLVRDNFNMGQGVIYANSMGGIESLNVLAQRKFPNVYAWAGTVPTTSLAAAYASASFKGAIDVAYGITGSSPNTYAEKTEGYDPLLKDPAVFRSLPMYFHATQDDAIIPIAENSCQFAPRVAPYNNVVTNYPATGGHSPNPTTYIAAITAFLTQYIAA